MYTKDRAVSIKEAKNSESMENGLGKEILKSEARFMYQLTDNEATIIKAILDSNCCGASNADELLADNMSCVTVEDMKQMFPMLNDQQIGGYISSLLYKGIIWEEEREDFYGYQGRKKILLEKFDNLFWVEDDFLSYMKPDFDWTGSSKLENITLHSRKK